MIYCPICFTYTEETPCRICTDPARASGVICVVEQPPDVDAIEKTHAFRGRYHVLHGALSPLDGIGPQELKIAELLRRIEKEQVHEVIISTDPTLAGPEEWHRLQVIGEDRGEGGAAPVCLDEGSGQVVKIDDAQRRPLLVNTSVPRLATALWVAVDWSMHPAPAVDELEAELRAVDPECTQSGFWRVLLDERRAHDARAFLVLRG